MNTFFTSDLHFFHQNIIQFCNRPWADVSQMNQGLVKNWNNVVSSKDTVWVLGDVSFGNPAETLDILGDLKGKINLIPGNHDRKGRAEKTPWEVRCNIFPPYHLLKQDNRKFVLCHFPFHAWERGWINLHGHTHGTYASKWMQHDVGVDVNNWTPLLLEDAVKRALGNGKKQELY